MAKNRIHDFFAEHGKVHGKVGIACVWGLFGNV